MPTAMSASFEVLLTAHREALLNRACKSVEDWDLAEDLVQETLLRAYAARLRFTPGTNLQAWLFCILDHLICDEYRKSLAIPKVIPWEDLPPELEASLSGHGPHQDQPEWSLLARVLSPELEMALNQLSPNLRRVLWMAAVEELSLQDIAARLGLEVGAVKMRLCRARREMQEALRHALRRKGNDGLQP